MKKVKVSVAQKTMKDPELIDMFNKMVGASEPDPHVIMPKYDKVLSLTGEVLDVLNSLVARSPLVGMLKFHFDKGVKDIEEFIKMGRAQIESMRLPKNDRVLTGDELNELNANPQKLMEYLASMNAAYKIQGLGEKYKNLKDCRVVQEMVMTARRLKNALTVEKERSRSEKNDLEDKDHLSNNFITKAEGDFLPLFPFSCLDFKQLYYTEKMTPEFDKYLLYVLHIIRKKVLDIVQVITSPDIDVDKFSEILVRSIKELKKHIPRCQDAFKKIEESVTMLKDNFNGYYHDFVTSQNPGIIIENFVGDVAKASANEANYAVTHQFKQIIAFYQKQMQGKVSDPRVKKMMSLVNQNLDILERKTSKRDNKKETTDQKEEVAPEEPVENLDDIPSQETPAPPKSAKPAARGRGRGRGRGK